MLRKRKTKDPCPGCFLHRKLCLCAAIPRLNLRTRVSLLVHHRELKRTTNTGRLAVKALINSELHVRGAIGARLDVTPLLTPAYRTVLFYPSEQALDLTADFVAQDPRPIHLLVPDGNWRQASKVATRYPELKQIAHVQIRAVNTARWHLRAEHKPEGMSTLEAIARALRIVEGEAAFLALMELYQLKLERTLMGRPAPAKVPNGCNPPPGPK